jgi:hypothetical protein
VREALGELGTAAKNQDILDWIQKKHRGVKISTSHVSNIKSNILRSGWEAPAAKGAGNATQARERKSSSGPLTGPEIHKLHELIQRIGKAELHAIIDLFEGK